MCDLTRPKIHKALIPSTHLTPMGDLVAIRFTLMASNQQLQTMLVQHLLRQLAN